MRQPMKCKRCGKVDGLGEINLSVYQNTYKEFPKGQYIFLCIDCYRALNASPMLTEPYTEFGTDQEFQTRMNQEVRR